MKRVVVTGLGAITPIGNNVKDFWEGLINGRNGVGEITHFDHTNYKTHFAAEVKNYDPLNYFDRKDVRKHDLYSQYDIVSAMEAIESSHLTPVNTDFDEVGVVLTAGIGGVTHFFNEVMEHAKGDGVPRMGPYYIPKMGTQLCHRFGLCLFGACDCIGLRSDSLWQGNGGGSRRR